MALLSLIGFFTMMPVTLSGHAAFVSAANDPSTSTYTLGPLVEGEPPLQMPVLGLGVYRVEPGEETYHTVTSAIKVGYRLIDTAAMYGNEEDVGRAWRASGVTRDGIFLTTKLNTDSHGYAEAMEATFESLHNLDTDYIDLLLIHSPFGGKIVETWDAMLELQRVGLVRSIGVSNFGIPHLEALREHGRPMPAVNQIEMHPLIHKQRAELVEYCRQHGIIITAYGSLFSGHEEYLQGQAGLQQIASKHGKTTAQVLLKWALQLRFAVIPKSTNPERQEENFRLGGFELSEEEMNLLLNDLKADALQEYWNPVEDAEVDLGDVSKKPRLEFHPDEDSEDEEEEEEDENEENIEF